MSTEDTARDELLRTWTQWRADRDAGFKKPYGALSLVALHWLDEDEAESFDEVPGVWRVTGGQVTVTASAADGLTLSGVPIDGETPIPLEHTTSGETLTYGDVVIEVIDRAGFAFRVRDPKAPALAAFTTAPAYAPEARWILDAAYEPIEGGKEVAIGSVVEGYGSTGTAVATARFQLDGEEHTLLVFDDGGGAWTLFRDATSGVTTNGSGRFIDIAAPGADGRVLLDFNRSSNLPCAFNDFSTCPVPPFENRLTVAVEAGEKIPV
ncbi:DUF1684 domain-containing protein [Phytomonospora endophytica]|uniref:DUF1684 domain-containing protein n=1 Tax=Phytomonospora endophytica TaxID=714109 RepID=A0A841G088_9ACTN|nr:DUF1684 domain-containing protein [Phytomonospora endophytica]MBB6037580.1 hypothetical protein [Phytomonospora endophytica]GIG67894.1 hypothetical protein Pen01_41890 [Phytomonospora endophytica]